MYGLTYVLPNILVFDLVCELGSQTAFFPLDLPLIVYVKVSSHVTLAKFPNSRVGVTLCKMNGFCPLYYK